MRRRAMLTHRRRDSRGAAPAPRIMTRSMRLRPLSRRPHRLHALRQARALSRSARRCCRRRARSASISTRSAADGPSAGAARSPSARANSPSTASSRSDSHLSAFSAVEERYDEKRGLPPAAGCPARPSCSAIVVIDVPPESQVHKQVVRKAAETRAIEIDPATRLYFIEVEEPDMHKPSSDLERVYRGARRAMGDRRRSPAILAIIARSAEGTAQGRMEDHRRRQSRAPGGGNRLIAIWPGFHDKALRPCHRCRLDHHRRPSHQSHQLAMSWPLPA